MRENRTYGSEGGEAQANASFLPLFLKSIKLFSPNHRVNISGASA